jgi:hypothetical protein
MSNQQTPIEEFAERLSERLAAHAPSGRNEYLHIGMLRQCIQEAAQPATPLDQQFPRMLYSNGAHRIVKNSDEEARALRDGYSRNAPAQYAAGYPKWFSEKPTGMGGTRGFDIRHITLHNPDEEKLFRAIVEIEAWQKDEVLSIWGARGVGLSDLIEDRKALAREVLDEDFLALATGESAEE